MKQNVMKTLVLTGATSLLLASCGGKFKIAESQVSANPNPLAVRGDAVPAKISIAFPAKSFPKSGKLRVTPVLRYQGGEKWGKAEEYQGESVKGNDKVVFYTSGANAVINFSVPYQPSMQRSKLFLLFDAKVGSKTVKVPAIKVADGVNATEALATIGGIHPAVAPHGFERIIKETYDADIMFQIQQADVRSSELKKEDIEEWKYTVQNAKETPNQRVSVEVQSYASPDGGRELNEKLSEKRERNTTASLKQEFKKQQMGDVAIDAHYTAQDWEGFRQLVEKSDLPDKALVLRVLSMYPDPEQREREIKNISAVFRQLADEVLPKLRRSRLIANVEIVGKSDEEIQDWLQKAPGHLSIEELLYAAHLAEKTSEKLRIYQLVNSIFPKDYRAYNNIGAILYAEGKIDEAEAYFNKAAVQGDSEVINLNRGLIALSKGQNDKATNLIASAINTPELGQALGYLYLKQGEYAKATTAFGETLSNNAAVAQILTGNYAKALSTLNALGGSNAITSLLKAIVAARTQDTSAALSALKEVITLDPSMVANIANNVEFASLAKLPAFTKLITGANSLGQR